MRELIYVLAACIVALIISARTIPTIIKVSHRLNLFAIPNGRSATTYRTPTLGGISIFLGFIMGMTLASDGYFVQGAIYIIAAVLIMFFTGLKDDVVSLSAKKADSGNCCGCHPYFSGSLQINQSSRIFRHSYYTIYPRCFIVRLHLYRIH